MDVFPVVLLQQVSDESEDEFVTIIRKGTSLSLVHRTKSPRNGRGGRGKVREEILFKTSLYDGEAHEQIGNYLADLRGNQILIRVYRLFIRHCDSASQIAMINELKKLVPKAAVRSHISKLVNDYKRLKDED